MEGIRFGSSGNPEEFYEKGYKASEQMPAYLSSLGLSAYEYQCSRGVRVSDQKAALLREEAARYGIRLSVHAPYYISLSSQEEEKQQKTIGYIVDSMAAAKKMGADRVVVHAGALLKLERSFAVESACALLRRAQRVADEKGLGSVAICPETMGKMNQLGDSREIVAMCQVDERMIPTIDFGHLYCRGLGTPSDEEEWKRELSIYIDGLGYERMKHFHAHFSPMEYTQKGGEKRHVTLADEGFGPDFRPIARALIALRLEPRILSESAGTQAIDAAALSRIYFEERESAEG